MKKNTNGFALFSALIAVTLIAIVGVVAFVALRKPVQVTGLPSAYVPPASPAAVEPVATMPPAPTTTPAPTISSSTDVQVIGKELDDTKVDSVDSDFNSMNSSASSL